MTTNFGKRVAEIISGAIATAEHDCSELGAHSGPPRIDITFVSERIAAEAEGHYRPRIETPDGLDALPDGAIYISDTNQHIPELKSGGVWYADGCQSPFEPDLPGTLLWPTADGEEVQP